MFISNIHDGYGKIFPLIGLKHTMYIHVQGVPKKVYNRIEATLGTSGPFWALLDALDTS